MIRIAVFAGTLAAACAAFAIAADEISFSSPGLAPSRMDAQGRLIEDWGNLGLKINGESAGAKGDVGAGAFKVDETIPGARAVFQRGPIAVTWTAFRAPAHPAGLDVLTVRVEEILGCATSVTLGLDLPPKSQAGLRTVRLGSRVILTLPRETAQEETQREWGCHDESTPIRGWAKPQGKCDPAFQNIRAGMGGVPIFYRFKVAPKSEANVVLGICESHWAEPGKRLLVCSVEGAPAQEVDPVAKWGRHTPGALLFKARDANGDGRLDLSVRAAAGAEDKNPILNAIWIFPAGEPPALAKVISGTMNAAATRVVDVGGDSDQTLYPPGKLEYALNLSARGAEELTFFVACNGESAPRPEATAWTEETLRRAAREVWRDWNGSARTGSASTGSASISAGASRK
ncbi:MAG: hypothetical protein NTX50_15325 [Candidatus Sumerlaeota bacterium]|nr:hypothetical protein [Candidatus Sumerlaeota bacterium]